ncbi:MAG TPA: xanthine dehydrogenase family protein subunit M [Desulfobacteraceae bacterium]|nr:xanthine dehydrogenase family protein subunit M [Desulfobacteraceae bacterium]
MRSVFLPKNLHEVWEAWDREPMAAVYAGGTDLLVKLRAGLMDPPALICIERVKELKGVRCEEDSVFIGAGNTHAELLDDKTVQAHFPVLVQALHVLAAPPIRHMGTIGGNVANASAAGDTLPPLYILDAEVEIWSRRGSRTLPITQFIQGPGKVLLKRGELVGGLRIKKRSGRWVHLYEKVGLRKAQACAVASLAAILKTDANGVVEEARLAWGSVGPTVVVCPEAEQALKGRPLCAEALRDAMPAVQTAISPIDDIRATASYRRHVAGSLLLRLSLLDES